MLLRRSVAAAAVVAGLGGIVRGAVHKTPTRSVTSPTCPARSPSSYTPTWEGFELYIKALNDRGGINGKKVDVVLDDDGLKADRAVAAAKKQAERDQVLGIFGLSLSSTQGPGLRRNAQGRRAGRHHIQRHRSMRCRRRKPFSYSTGVVFEVAGEAIGELGQNIKPGGKVVGMTIDSVGGRAALAHNKKAVEAAGGTWDEVIFPVDHHRLHAVRAGGDREEARRCGRTLRLRPESRRHPGIAPFRLHRSLHRRVLRRDRRHDQGRPRSAPAAARTSTTSRVMPRRPTTIRRWPRSPPRRRNTARPSRSRACTSTGWALGKFAEAALKDCGWPCTREKLDRRPPDAQGRHGRPDRRPDRDVSRRITYGPSYWRLYVWNAKAKAMEPKSDWVKKNAAGFK